MAAILPGYEYDIFISYRQKDNKADRWVTHFVEALNNEIEATFKEDISIYFDENPHDGLLETHDVDQSLSEKIKVLVFIPIISQTYCDPISFAWQKEFVAFRDFARDDELGLDIKLANGNVCKRILPVRIHEIDTVDQELYEKETAGIMRPVDFIYKDSGVNRPLRPNEEFPEENLNHTLYRNQINKVANAIKEIIAGIRGDEVRISTENVINSEGANESSTKIYNLKSKTIWTAVALLLILSFTYVFINRENSDSEGIAVLTFSNFSNEEGNQYFAAGITEAVRNNLGQTANLKVISRNSIEKFEKLNLSTPEMASALDVKYVLDGSVQKDVNNIRINVQLIDAKTDVQIWSEVYNRPYEDILGIQSDIASDIAGNLKLTANPNFDGIKSQQQIKNIEAYDLYLKGMDRVRFPSGSQEELNNTLKIFDQVLEIDPTFAHAYLGKAQAYLNDVFFARSNITEIKGETMELIMKAMELDNGIPECYSLLGTLYYHELKFNKAKEYLEKAIRLNPNDVDAHKWLAYLYFLEDEFDKSISLIDNAIMLDPLNPGPKSDKATLFFAIDMEEASIQLETIVDETNNDYARFLLALAYTVNKELDKGISTFLSRKVKGADTNWALGYAYGLNGDLENAQKCLEYTLNRKSEVFVPSYLICIIYVGLGEYETALDWLEKEYSEGPSYIYIFGMKGDPKLTPLEGNPRYEALLAKLPFKRI